MASRFYKELSDIAKEERRAEESSTLHLGPMYNNKYYDIIKLAKDLKEGDKLCFKLKIGTDLYSYLWEAWTVADESEEDRVKILAEYRKKAVRWCWYCDYDQHSQGKILTKRRG